MLRLGAHNSIAGGLENAVAECQAIGGEGLQVFCKNQRQWVARPLAPEEIASWKSAVAAAGVGPVMVHDSYLINMGQPDRLLAEKSRLAFQDEYERTEALGIQYLNFHPGSHVHESKHNRDDKATRDACLERIAQNCAKTLDACPGFAAKLVIENAAGQGSNVGSSWAEVGRILDLVGEKKRMGVTVDTQHAWASGYDWRNAYDAIWDEFDAQVGLGHLVVFHLNDSKTPCGGRTDRHDTIGTGLLGLDFFRELVNDRRFDGRLGILETPEGPESWKREIALLRSLRTDAPRARKPAAAGPKAAKKGRATGLDAFA